MNRLFTSDYRRESGIHDFYAHDGTAVTSLSAANWEEFSDLLASTEPRSGYYITPELITTPLPLEEIPDSLPLAGERVEAVVSLSRQHPDATILLGTPSVDDAGTVRNSLAVIKDGELRGHIDKRGTMWPEESRLFSRELRSQNPLINVGHAVVICSDVVSTYMAADRPDSSRRLPETVNTLLVSSTWAIPRSEAFGVASPHPPEERFRGTLERAVTSLFKAYPSLSRVIFTDRTPQGGTTRPFNAQFEHAPERTEEVT